MANDFKLGSVITFRYTSPTARDRAPMIMVLTMRHADGHVHGINLRYVEAIEQQQLLYYFKTPDERAQEVVDPFEQEEEIAKAKYNEYMKGQKDAEEFEHGVVVKPAKTSPFGGVSTFGSSFGMGRAIIDKMKNAFGQLRKYVPFGGSKPPPVNVSKQSIKMLNLQNAPHLNDPYRFYYEFVKPLFGRKTKNVYRKYNYKYISNIRDLTSTKRL